MLLRALLLRMQAIWFSKSLNSEAIARYERTVYRIALFESYINKGMEDEKAAELAKYFFPLDVYTALPSYPYTDCPGGYANLP
jgi:hypothetical protein